MSQPRKRTRSPEEKKRRQRILNRIVLVIVLLVIVILTAVGFTRQTTVPLPAYLDRCVTLTGSLAYSSTFELQILADGKNQSVASRIGIVGTCVRPIHTFSPSGTAHIDTDENRTYTLGDFFLVWGNTFGPNFATFNQNQVLTFRTDQEPSHSIRMTVNNYTDTRFQDYPLPKNGNTQTNLYRIVITYGPS